MVMARQKMGKCFIDKKACDINCVLYRRGIRYYDAKDKLPEPFEECAINIIADCVENMISRTIGLQAEQNKVNNSIVEVSSILKYALESKGQGERRGGGKVYEIGTVRAEKGD